MMSPAKRLITSNCKLLLALFGLILIGKASAQAQEIRPDDSVSQVALRIKAEANNNSEVMSTLSSLSDVYGPRLLGTRYYFEAAQWAMRELKSWGLENARLDPFGGEFRGWMVEDASIKMSSPRYMPIIAYPKAFSSGTNGIVIGTPLLVESMDAIRNFEGSLVDRIIMVANVEPSVTSFEPFSERFSIEDLRRAETITSPAPDPDMAINPEDLADTPFLERLRVYAENKKKNRALQQFLIDENVAAIIEPSAFTHGIVHVGGTGFVRQGDLKPVAQFVIANEHFYRVKRMLDKGVSPILEVNLKTDFVHDPMFNVNIMADIKGNDPAVVNEIVLIGAHFDSWHAGTGATDNGAGAAAMMEAMRIIKALDLKPRRTIRLALWGGEEAGYNGSMDYARRHVGDIFSGDIVSGDESIAIYINQDLGTGRVRGIYLQGNERIRPILKSMLQPFSTEGSDFLTLQNTNYTDHEVFAELGIPSFTLLQDMINTYSVSWHSNMDVYEYAIADDLKHNAAYIASLAYQLAMYEGELPSGEDTVRVRGTR